MVIELMWVKKWVLCVFSAPLRSGFFDFLGGFFQVTVGSGIAS